MRILQDLSDCYPARTDLDDPERLDRYWAAYVVDIIQEGLSADELREACAIWRRSGERFFAHTSGQLIEKYRAVVPRQPKLKLPASYRR